MHCTLGRELSAAFMLNKASITVQYYTAKIFTVTVVPDSALAAGAWDAFGVIRMWPADVLAVERGLNCHATAPLG